jgi:DNA-binding NtrC family response regulator
MNESSISILVAEDDPEMLDLLDRVLRDEGYNVIPARNGKEALARIAEGGFDVVLSDIRMPGYDGMEVLRGAMARDLSQPVILMTAFGSIESAVQAMREGAWHYLAKPFDIDDLVEVVGQAASRVRGMRAVESARGARVEQFFPVVFTSRAMVELLQMARDVAASNATVQISGSSGTGKELLARAIHGLSRRADRPFVAVDCNSIPEALLESEMFGHRRGAFTGAVADKRGLVEEASGGTLFLDEVGNLSMLVQGKLLRFLQERRFRRVGGIEERAVDVRVISATNRDLAGMVERGLFREDLFYRLSVIPMRIPDLKDRREDIPPLVYHFVRTFNLGYKVEGVRQDALELMVTYPWPGNVRQLENVIERAVILRKAGLIQPRDLPEDLVSDSGERTLQSLEDMERDYILRLLVEHGHNQSRVARILGINRRTLYRKLQKIGGEG